MSDAAVLPSGMFWHIFRKDLRLLRWLAVTSASLQVLQSVVTFHSDPYPLSEPVSAAAALVTLALLVAMCLVIAFAVQQDPVPGVNQDWLVRPIRRWDLLLSKLLAVLLLIHGPIFAANMLVGLAEGYSFTRILHAAVLGHLEIALLFSLPVMTVAALTRSIGEALIGSLAVFVGLVLVRLLIVVLLLPVTHAFHFSGPVDGTGIEWIWRFVSHAALLTGVVTALAVQYFRRNTFVARVAFVGGLFLFMMIQGLPWNPAFALQEIFSPNPQAGEAIHAEFDPELPRRAGTDGILQLLGEDADSSDSENDSQPARSGRIPETTRVTLPIRISGLPAGMILHADRCAFRIITAGGRTVYRGVGEIADARGRSQLTSSSLPPQESGPVVLRQKIKLPTSFYGKAGLQPLRIELDYSFTLLSARTLPSLAALDGQGGSNELGRCATRIDTAGNAVEVGCRKAGELPFCLSMSLQQGELHNPERFVCELNYEPAGLRFGSDPIDHLHTKLPFRDPTGVGHFPVGPASLRDAQVIVVAYEPEDHFSRHITLPPLRLRDWHSTGP